MKICLFDPGLEDNNGSPSLNLGDLIIQEAVNREISQIFFGCDVIHVSTHVFPHDQTFDMARDCHLFLVGGTNLLNSKMNVERQWRFSLRKQVMLGKSILLGVGWRQYEEKPNLQTQLIFKNILSSKMIHSVRDAYTQQQLSLAGIKNVLNTGCPTMWPLLDIKFDEIPSQKSRNALVMLTDYAKEPELDKKLFEIVDSKYENVFVWPQGRGDQEYVRSLSAAIYRPVIMLPHSFDSFKGFLDSGIQFDYIGTRLHGGVKCLINRRRALIIEIDNRAREIARDTNLPTVERTNFDEICQWIDNPSPTLIKLDNNAIEKWRNQFKPIVLRQRELINLPN